MGWLEFLGIFDLAGGLESARGHIFMQSHE